MVAYHPWLKIAWGAGMWKKVYCYGTLSKRLHLKGGFPFHSSLVGAEVQSVHGKGLMSIDDSNLWRNSCDTFIHDSFVLAFKSFVNNQT